MSHCVNFSLSIRLSYSLKITNYGMRKKNIFYIYGCFSVFPYIKGSRKTHLYTLSHFWRHVKNNPYWQKGETIFLSKYHIVISDTLKDSWMRFLVARCNIIGASWEIKKENWVTKKVYRRICARGITFLVVNPSSYIMTEITRSRLRSEPTSSLRENHNKEKELFLKIASSQTFSWNGSSQQES